MEPKVVINFEDYQYQIPTKIIDDHRKLQCFQKSEDFKNFFEFIHFLQQSVRQKPISSTVITPCLIPLQAMLEKLDKWVDAIPPVKQSSEFGNKSFIKWLEKVKNSTETLLDDVLQAADLKNALPELKEYLVDSFGFEYKVEYGCVNELNFLQFLYCLNSIGIYDHADFEALINKIFYKYVLIMRKIQSTYMMNTAGFQGMGGFDDYHVLPYLFGASQLVEHGTIDPQSALDDSILKTNSNDYMYLSCIAHIKTVKKGVPFGEISPLLNDISGVSSWEKISNGMVKMYQHKVLNNLSLMQHFKFGSIIKNDISRNINHALLR